MATSMKENKLLITEEDENENVNSKINSHNVADYGSNGQHIIDETNGEGEYESDISISMDHNIVSQEPQKEDEEINKIITSIGFLKSTLNKEQHDALSELELNLVKLHHETKVLNKIIKDSGAGSSSSDGKKFAKENMRALLAVIFSTVATILGGGGPVVWAVSNGTIICCALNDQILNHCIVMGSALRGVWNQCVGTRVPVLNISDKTAGAFVNLIQVAINAIQSFLASDQDPSTADNIINENMSVSNIKMNPDGSAIVKLNNGRQLTLDAQNFNQLLNASTQQEQQNPSTQSTAGILHAATPLNSLPGSKTNSQNNLLQHTKEDDTTIKSIDI